MPELNKEEREILAEAVSEYIQFLSKKDYPVAKVIRLDRKLAIYFADHPLKDEHTTDNISDNRSNRSIDVRCA